MRILVRPIILFIFVLFLCAVSTSPWQLYSPILGGGERVYVSRLLRILLLLIALQGMPDIDFLPAKRKRVERVHARSQAPLIRAFLQFLLFVHLRSHRIWIAHVSSPPPSVERQRRSFHAARRPSAEIGEATADSSFFISPSSSSNL